VGFYELKLKETLFRVTKQSSFPNIFIGKRHIGGSRELQELDRSGKLDELLKELGIL
jgi:glutaredoxin 3